MSFKNLFLRLQRNRNPTIATDSIGIDSRVVQVVLNSLWLSSWEFGSWALVLSKPHLTIFFDMSIRKMSLSCDIFLDLEGWRHNYDSDPKYYSTTV